MRSRASGGARERSIAACKSSRTLLCECGGWEAAALLCSALSLYNAGLSAHIAHSVHGKRDPLLLELLLRNQQKYPHVF